MVFLLEKVLLDRQLLPGNQFDWSMAPGQLFRRENMHEMSISSCDIRSMDMSEGSRTEDNTNHYTDNIIMFRKMCQKTVNPNNAVMAEAKFEK